MKNLILSAFIILSFQSSAFAQVLRTDVSAFGEKIVVIPHPSIVMQFAYNINTAISSVTTTNGATVTQADGMAVVTSGAQANSIAQLHSLHDLKYQPGTGNQVRFTALFTQGVDLSTQTAGIHSADNSDGLMWGYNGTDFGVNRMQNGTPFWTSSSEFNVDKLDGTGPSGFTLDPTKMNVYQIRYQWLGAGNIFYEVEDPNCGCWIIAHMEKYAGANIIPSIYNPSLPLSVRAVNHGNTTAITVKTSSMAGYQDGDVSIAGIKFSTRSPFGKTVSTTEVPIITISNKDVYQSKNNRVGIRFLFFSFAVDGTKLASLGFYANATLTNASYIDIDTTNSVIEVDTEATAFSGGNFVSGIIMGKTDSQSFFTKEIELELAPGETFTITGRTFGGTSDVAVNILWEEKF